MIHFLSATPGSGKSLLATERMLNLSRDNIANLKFNYLYAKAVFEKISFLKLDHYLDSIVVTQGQGLERTSEIIFLESDYFDFLRTEYFINVISNPQTDDIVTNFPPYYFERIAILNLIVDELNEKENTKFQHFKPVRTIYTNIADLKLVQCRPLPSDCDWRKTPQGSYFVIDEAQLITIFSDEARGIDPIVKDLTIHRHKGYDFLFITQEPSFVHKYIRKLASHHIHLVNIFGWEQSMKMEWSVVQDSPNAIKSIARVENLSRWRFPKHVYPLYKSTTINTREKRIPRKLVLVASAAAFCFLLAILMFFFKDGESPLISMITGKPIATEQKKNEPKPTDKPAAQQSSDPKQTDPKALQKENALDSSTAASEPVVSAESTYSASDPFAYEPVYVAQPVNHRVFSGCLCIKNSCSAYDQQGTKISGINPKVCKDLINESSSRPFDYFNNREQRAATERVSTSELTQSAPQPSSL
ncbi:zonular occludens toxin domain-containing protein [Acinetobacter sp. 102]|uniref:zonular occludens toxin domain-containing protein n=1 Tax=Acinetobacter sp. 102 TaxID=3098766 RepID=UPI003009058A